MNRRLSAACGAAVIAMLVFAGAHANLAARQQQAPPAAKPQQQGQPIFKGGITVVPIDVRVIDNRTNKPVDDLKQEDFTLEENDAAQRIAFFEHHTMAPDPEEAKNPARPAIRETPFDVTPQTHRIFLIMLGLGRLQEPSKALDVLLNFVRNQLLPQDEIAVFAYDRATEFTRDHEAIAKLVERFRDAHYKINMDITGQMNSGLAAIYGSTRLPKPLQSEIDAMFQGSGLLASTPMAPGETKRASADARQTVDALQRADINTVNSQLASAVGASGGVGAYTFQDEIAASAFTDMGLDDFIAANAQTLMDLGNCYAGIEYLRHLEGEKHMVFLSEKGMRLGRVDDDKELARAANDARVAIDTFQTGGVEGQKGGAAQSNWSEVFAFQAMRNIAEFTGGVSAVAENVQKAMNKLNDVTLSDYVIGYYPALSNFNGEYRKIKVKVNRPDVTVLYRQGYYARRDIGAFDRRTFITQDRLEAAGKFGREIKDIKVKLDASLQKVGDAAQVTIKSTIDPSRLAWTVANGKHSASIDLVVIVSDQNGKVIGQNYQRANVDLTEDVWQTVVKGGIPYNAHMESTMGARAVRLIVYDYHADLVGSADARVW